METNAYDELAAAFTAHGFELIETHISRVYLRGQDVYKTKRAVNLGFLDFSTLSQRERACQAEVELNRRLAPGVYLGVSAITEASRDHLTFIPKEQLRAEPVLEWAVHMRRLRDEDRADLQLDRGELGPRDMENIATLLAEFHACAQTDQRIASFGSQALIARNVEENFEQVKASIGDYLDQSEHSELIAFQRAFIKEHAALFEQRARSGRVRDGHGDLRLEHLYRHDGQYLAIDCIEFNERFRYADVCCDLAFLTMDLAYHARMDLADLLIASYARESQDYESYALLDFYQSYRAVVRAKVASMLASDLSVGTSTRERAQSEARRYYLLALSVSRRALVQPRIIVTFGLIASGKSKLATGLSTRLGVATLSADRTRKQLLAAAPTEAIHEQPFQGAYSAETTEQVYDTMLARAERILRSGRSVILDATFRSRAHRAKVRALSETLSVQLTFMECRCPRELTMQRLQRRAQAPSLSDGRAEIFDTLAASFEPVTELPCSQYLLLETSTPADQTLARALRALGEDEPPNQRVLVHQAQKP